MSQTTRLGRWRRLRYASALTVGFVGMMFAGATVARTIAAFDGNPTVLLAFGEQSEETLAYGVAKLGDVDARPFDGHDGKFFFVQANDPLFLNPEDHARVLDRPLYRSQRMLYPLIAGALGFFDPWAVVWSMILVNLLAMGAGTWGTARLAENLGGSAWWGLAFGLNVGLLSELFVSGGGVVGFALAVWGLVALERDEVGRAAMLLGLAALSREALLLVAGGAAFWAWRYRRIEGWQWLAVVPVGMVGAWAIYLRFRLGFDSGIDQVQEIGLPFVGFVEAIQLRPEGLFNSSIRILMMVILLVFARRALISRNLLAWATIGFVPLAIVFTKFVWFNYFDITRAVAPVITAFALLVLAAARDRKAGELRASRK